MDFGLLLKLIFGGTKKHTIVSIGIINTKNSNIKLAKSISDSIEVVTTFSKNCKNSISYTMQNGTKKDILEELKRLSKITTPKG